MVDHTAPSRTSPRRIALFAHALSVVVLVRLALSLFPSRFILRHVNRRVRRAARPATATPLVRSVGWAVRAASRRVPRATCLTQALSAQLLLARHGLSSQLKLGVARDASGLAAHAWVVVDGKVLVGGSGSARYRELPDFDALL